MLFVRPQEWVPLLLNQRLMKWVIGAALVSWLGSLMHSNWRLRDAPQNWLMLGLFFAILMSHVAHAYLAATIAAFLDFGKIVLLYLLIVSLVTSLKRAKGLVLAMVIGCLFMSAWGIWQAHSPEHYGFAGYGDPYYRAVEQPIVQPDGQESVIWRVRALGIFRDPNDLSLMLVAVLPFLFATVLSGAASRMARFLSLAAAGPMLYCIYLTNSRGGWLALAVMVVAFFYIYIPSRKLGLALAGVTCIAVLALGPSRMATVSSDEGSARGRLSAWGEGNRMLKSSPLFGVGKDMYGDFSEHGRVAHNSFVHCWAELGLFGYFFWLGMVISTAKDGWALSRTQPPNEAVAELSNSGTVGREKVPTAEAREESAELRRMGRAALAGLVGFMAAALFLSRTYVIPLYVMFALVAALRQIYDRSDYGPLPSSFKPKDLKLVLAAVLVSIPALYLALRLIQR